MSDLKIVRHPHPVAETWAVKQWDESEHTSGPFVAVFHPGNGTPEDVERALNAALRLVASQHALDACELMLEALATKNNGVFQAAQAKAREALAIVRRES